ncbi:MAG TPA: methylmalonyl Co-A mutase-associated GTPase MeaB, partial [Geodermatophilus sp.]|nr:methylmalonyl Co-A mutase-associated GTPase MeaB [Geodermatophilus sp.]
LGGVAEATRESMVVVEAAGYDVVLVETVGVGQSEVTVAEMVDSFLFLTLARTGDQLQGIKRGILEIADVIAVNKADGPAAVDARKAARELAGAIRMLRGHVPGGWDVPVLTCSGLTGDGLDQVWAKLVEHQERMRLSGEFEERRRAQQVRWTWHLVHDGLEHALRSHPGVRSAAPELEKAVLAGELTPALAAQQLLETFLAAPEDVPAVTP